MFKKLICSLIGHDHRLRRLPSDPRMWCDFCGKDFTEEVEKEMEIIRKEHEAIKKRYENMPIFPEDFNQTMGKIHNATIEEIVN